MTDFAATKAMFHLPNGMVYLDGNSLGPLPNGVVGRAREVIEREWGDGLIRSWNQAGWMAQPRRVGDSVGRLIGAPADSVVMGDTLSIKVYQALAAAVEMRPDRKVVLSDSGNFPTDLYMADGLLKTIGQNHVLRVVAPHEVAGAITEDVAAVMLTQVDYRTGRMHDIAKITSTAHAAGALAIWDLAHSAGALPVDVRSTEADFAVGCTYKYLNGGPGAPAFIYVRPDLAERARPALSGWFGHQAPFAFDLDYQPGRGIERMRVGTPPVVQMSILEEAMKVWDRVDMEDIRAASLALSQRFIEGVEAACPELHLASPRDGAVRGSQVSFRHPQGYAIMQALISENVIGDFRAPDILRFGLTPLYIDANDVDHAVGVLSDIMKTGAWDRPEFHTRSAVT